MPNRRIPGLSTHATRTLGPGMPDCRIPNPTTLRVGAMRPTHGDGWGGSALVLALAGSTARSVSRWRRRDEATNQQRLAGCPGWWMPRQLIVVGGCAPSLRGNEARRGTGMASGDGRTFVDTFERVSGARDEPAHQAGACAPPPQHVRHAHEDTGMVYGMRTVQGTVVADGCE